MLFLRMAQQLAHEFDVYVVDHLDGYMGSRVPEGVTLLDIDSAVRFPDDAVLVVQSLRPWNLAAFERFCPATRVLFWNLHPYNLYPYLFSDYGASPVKRIIGRVLRPLSALRLAKLERVVQYLVQQHALVFMDEENRTRTGTFFPRIGLAPRYLPVLTDVPVERHAVQSMDTLRCGWVGRLVDFKAHILSHLMDRLDVAAAATGSITLTVIGDGDHLEGLQAQAALLTRIAVTFVPHVPLEQLGNFLDNEVDVLFAMGSSALDGASRGIPTFLVDYSFRPVEGKYRFRMIHESTGFSLGNLITPDSYEAESSLEESLREVRRNYVELAALSYEFWRANHSPDAVMDRFRECIGETTATISEMGARGFFTPDPISKAILAPLRRLTGITGSSGFDNL